MYKFKRFSTIIIPKEYENNTWYWDITESLLRTTRGYRGADSIQNKFYYMSDKNLYIPRYFPINDYVSCEIEDKSCEGEDIDIVANIKPKNDLQRNAMRHMLSRSNATVQLEPGTGKTVISIYVVGQLKKKTLVLVHRDSLEEQWRDRFAQFTNIHQDQIATLSSNSFVEDLSKPIIISTVQTFLSLLKRKRNKFLEEIFKANIGIFIADEVHTTLGAKTFSECSSQIPARYVYGLSATPYRLDGNGDIITYHSGPIYIDDDSGSTVPARVMIMLFNSGLHQSKSHGFITYGKTFRRERYLNMLRKSTPFMRICKMLLKKMIEKDKNIVFVGERVKNLLSPLYTWLKSDDKTMFTAGVKNEVLSSQVVFTTPNKMRDGVDAPWKDCLIMTTPIGNISQMCGRVTRGHDPTNKQYTTVIDMCDLSYYDISKSIRTRLTYYENKNWDITFVLANADGTQFVNISKSAALHLATRT